MPTVPHPDPLYPVVWADTPEVPDSSPTPIRTPALLDDDDDPIQLHLDEALVRKADNDTVGRWKAFSGPWFDARGEEAAARWKEIQQGLNEIVRRPLGELATTRQRNMYRDLMEPRLSAWGGEARAHGEREAQAFNDVESERRQDLALAAMRRGAQLNDMHAVAESRRRLIEEVRGRNRRQRLDPDAASLAEADALAAAHSDVVEHLAQHDPQRAQDWLNTHGRTIGDPAKADRLNRMLQPYVAEQQQELVDQRQSNSISGALPSNLMPPPPSVPSPAPMSTDATIPAELPRSVMLLGRTLPITFPSEVNAADRIKATKIIGDMTKILNDQDGKGLLSETDRKYLSAIQGLGASEKRGGMELGTKTFYLSMKDIGENPDPRVYAANTIHDGGHQYLYNTGMTAVGVPAEQELTQTQIDYLKRVAAPTSYIDYLEKYKNDPIAIEQRRSQPF